MDSLSINLETLVDHWILEAEILAPIIEFFLQLGAMGRFLVEQSVLSVNHFLMPATPLIQTTWKIPRKVFGLRLKDQNCHQTWHYLDSVDQSNKWSNKLFTMGTFAVNIDLRILHTIKRNIREVMSDKSFSCSYRTMLHLHDIIWLHFEVELSSSMSFCHSFRVVVVQNTMSIFFFICYAQHEFCRTPRVCVMIRTPSHVTFSRVSAHV